MRGKRFEDAVDVIRAVMHEWARLESLSKYVYSMRCAGLGSDADLVVEALRSKGKGLESIAAQKSAAWSRVRPAIREAMGSGSGLTFNEYADLAAVTALYKDRGKFPAYPVFGLCGEVGELSEKVKKMYRDDDGVLTDERRQSMIDELGDILWYLAAMAFELGVSLDEIAQRNVEKLRSRMERDKIHGDGDNR